MSTERRSQAYRETTGAAEGSFDLLAPYLGPCLLTDLTFGGLRLRRVRGRIVQEGPGSIRADPLGRQQEAGSSCASLKTAVTVESPHGEGGADFCDVDERFGEVEGKREELVVGRAASDGIVVVLFMADEDRLAVLGTSVEEPVVLRRVSQTLRLILIAVGKTVRLVQLLPAGSLLSVLSSLTQ